MKLTMGTFVMGGNLLMTKFNFVFVKFDSLNSHINVKSNNRFDKLKKGSNL